MEKIKELISEKDITIKVKEIANTLYDKYKEEELVFICTLKGAVFFACDLLKKYEGDAKLEFIRVSSYTGKTSTGKIELNLSLSKDNIESKNIIIIEDIVDTGNTLKFLKGYINEMHPKSLEICSLLDKKERREVDIDADYVVFSIDDLFVVGYGLDYDQKYRNLPYIGVIE